MRKFTILFAFFLFLGMQATLAQQVTGTVTDAADGTKLPGVSVVVKGTTIGTVTNNDGIYDLDVPEGYNLLSFSFIGMIPQEITIDGRAVIDIALAEDVVGLDEVVVTAIGISREKKALGYSVQDVSGDQISHSANAQLVNSLNGRVAGVQVISNSGAAGAGTYINIRGSHTIIGNNQPLFVIDGVPIDNSTSLDNAGFEDDVAGVARSNRAIDLNPEDIETMAVLKGGQATALYGLRAANGAIVITTKKGKATVGKKVNVTFSQSVAFDKISQTMDLNQKYAQGIYGDWYSGYFSSWGPRMDTMSYSRDPGVWENPGFDVDGALVSKNDPTATGENVKAYDHYDFFRTGVTSNTSVGFSGGSDVARFYASASYLNQQGVVPNNSWDRLTLMINGETRLSKRISISGMANYIESGGDRIQQGSNTSGVMLGLLRTPPSFNNNGQAPGAPNSWSFNDGTQRNYRAGGGYDNPYWTANENKYTDKVKRIIGNVALTYIPADWLTVTWRVGTDMYSRLAQDYFAINSRTAPDGQVFADAFTARDFNSDLLLTFNKRFSDDEFGFVLLLGHNLYERLTSRLTATASGLELPNFYSLSNTSTIVANQTRLKLRRAGLFFDLGFDWKRQFYINITGRNDWSTTLPEQNNSFFYPSVGASWIFTELPALQGNNVVRFGKLRASYAVTAVDAPSYNTTTTYVKAFPSDGWVSPFGLEFPLLGQAGFTYSDDKGNADLKPERTATWEIGVEMKFWADRLGVDLGYFSSRTTDLLLPVSVANSSGFGSLFLNAAEMTNKGIELVLYGSPVKTEKFTWDIMVNFTKIDNEVVELYENVENIFLGGFTDPQIRAVAGEPYRSIYGYDWTRDESGNVLINEDGFPYGDYSNMISIGKVDPEWTMGFNNIFRFFGVTVSALFDYKKGGLMWNGTRGALYYFGTHADTESREPGDLVVFEGVKASNGEKNDIEVVKDIDWYLMGEGSGFTGPTIDYIEETGWIRLRELTIAYDFGAEVIGENGFFKSLQVYFTGRNLWLSTDYTGIDPETNLLGSVNAQGMDYFNMPGTKTYLIGLKAGF